MENKNSILTVEVNKSEIEMQTEVLEKILVMLEKMDKTLNYINSGLPTKPAHGTGPR